MLQPYLNASQIASIAAAYLNANSLKSEIAVDAIQKSELVHHHFIDIKSDFDIEYTYQSGSLDDAAYQAAKNQHETSYQHFQAAEAQWHAADEAARRASRARNPNHSYHEGTNAIRPRPPTSPNREDYIRWGEYYTETVSHQGRVTKPIQPERLPAINKKSFESYDEMKHFIPASLAEQEGYVFTKIDSVHVKNAADSLHKTAADTAVANALADYYHRNVTHRIVSNRSRYADLIAPIWDVTFNDDSKSKKIYIDEINGVIDGERIDESKIWAAIFGKHLVVMCVLNIALMQVMGGFTAFICAALLQFSGFYGLYLYHKTSRAPSAKLAQLLDFFYIRELANQADPKTQHQLDQYLIGLEAYEAFVTHKKQREIALLSHPGVDSFVALPN